MKKIVTSTVLMFMGVLLTTGCASVPESKEDEGVRYAISDSEHEIDELVKSGIDDKSEYILSDENGYRCVCKLGEGEQKFVVDAPVINYEVETVASIEAEPCPTMLNKEKIKECFFKNEDMIENAKPEIKEDTEQSGEDVLVIVGMPSTQDVFYSNEDHTKEFFYYTDAGFFYDNHTLIGQYKNIDFAGGIVGNNDISDQYTMKMAEDELIKTLFDISGMDIIVTNSNSVIDDAGNGYYEFEFTSTVDGIGLVLNDRCCNADNTIDSYGLAVMGEDGISEIQANNLIWEKTKTYEQQDCLRLGEALSLVEKYISSGEIPCNEKMIYSRCGLEYIARTDDWIKAKMTPVWRFHVPSEEMAGTVMDELWCNGIPMDICINAVDGTIEQVE